MQNLKHLISTAGEKKHAGNFETFGNLIKNCMQISEQIRVRRCDCRRQGWKLIQQINTKEAFYSHMCNLRRLQHERYMMSESRVIFSFICFLLSLCFFAEVILLSSLCQDSSLCDTKRLWPWERKEEVLWPASSSAIYEQRVGKDAGRIFTAKQPLSIAQGQKADQ